MSFLLDTDTVVNVMQGRRSYQAFLRSLTPQRLAISLITYGEVYEGIYDGLDPARHEQVFRSFLRGVTVLSLNKPIMKRYARLRGELRRAGQLIGDADTLIAATALHHHLTLVTGNMRHFNRVPNLALLAPP